MKGDGLYRYYTESIPAVEASNVIDQYVKSVAQAIKEMYDEKPDAERYDLRKLWDIQSELKEQFGLSTEQNLVAGEKISQLINAVSKVVVKGSFVEMVNTEMEPDYFTISDIEAIKAHAGITVSGETVSEPKPATAEISSGYDVEFDETAYSPDVQEVSVVVDDIPEDHEPDIQPIQTSKPNNEAVSYTDVRDAYEEYCEAEYKYLTSDETDIAEKEKSDTAFKKYLTLLAEYRKGSMPEREGVLNWIREYCGGSVLPVNDLLLNNDHDYLVELSHKCGIHAEYFKEYCTSQDVAVRLIREAGLKSNLKTHYEQAVKERKEVQVRLHELWQKRHALRKAQRMFGEGSVDAEALSDVWEMYQDEVDALLGEYRLACEWIKRGRKYEADSHYGLAANVSEFVAVQDLIMPKIYQRNYEFDDRKERIAV